MIASAVQTYRINGRPAVQRHQSRAAVVQLLGQMRLTAGDAVTLAFASNLKSVERLPGFHRFLLSRSRKGQDCNPLYRLGGWVMALYLDGQPRSVAQGLVDWLQDLVDRLYAKDVRSVNDISRAEQEEEGAETSYQVAYHAGDKSVRKAWLARLRKERQQIGELIIALEAEEREAGE